MLSNRIFTENLCKILRNEVQTWTCILHYCLQSPIRPIVLLAVDHLLRCLDVFRIIYICSNVMSLISLKNLIRISLAEMKKFFWAVFRKGIICFLKWPRSVLFFNPLRQRVKWKSFFEKTSFLILSDYKIFRISIWKQKYYEF